MLLKSPPTVTANAFADRRRRLRAVAVLVALIATAAAVGLGWRRWSLASEDAAEAYETRQIALGVVEKTISATGSAKALITVDVGSQLSGLIAEIKVDFNDPVKAGDLLAVIERAPYEAKAASAEASLAIARADVGQKEAAVTRVLAQIAQAKRDLDRSEVLAPRGFASHVQRDQYQTQYQMANADLAIARAQLEAAEGTVSLRQADLAKAQIDLGHTLIRSPINGVVIDRKMQPGQAVAAEYQTPVLFQLAQDLSQILIYAQVDEADIGAVKAGAPATFTVEAFPDEIFEGKVDQVRLAAAKISGVVTYTVVIRAQNPDLRLFPDMTATVHIVGARRENALQVPNDALRFRPQPVERGKAQPEAAVVWTPDPSGSLEPRRIALGLRGDSTTEVVGGDVHAGQTVAVRAKRGSGSGRI